MPVTSGLQVLREIAADHASHPHPGADGGFAIDGRSLRFGAKGRRDEAFLPEVLFESIRTVMPSVLGRPGNASPSLIRRCPRAASETTSRREALPWPYPPRTAGRRRDRRGIAPTPTLHRDCDSAKTVKHHLTKVYDSWCVRTASSWRCSPCDADSTPSALRPHDPDCDVVGSVLELQVILMPAVCRYLRS